MNRMFVLIGESEKHKIGSGTKLFIYLIEFKVFRNEERETQFLTMLTVRTSSALNLLTQPTCGHPVDLNWSRLGKP